jgi:hypothetical protein
MEEINTGRDSISISIYESVLELRHNRCLMVQTEDQYVYIHDYIVELLRERNAPTHINEAYSIEPENIPFHSIFGDSDNENAVTNTRASKSIDEHSRESRID